MSMSRSSFASVQLSPRQQYKLNYQGSSRRVVVNNEVVEAVDMSSQPSIKEEKEDSHGTVLYRPSIKNLKRKVLEEFPYLEDRRFVFEFVDDENEAVCCDTDCGLMDALRLQFIDNELKGTCALPRFTVRILDRELEKKQSFSSNLINSMCSYTIWSLLVYLVIELLRNERIEVLLARNDLLLVALILGFFCCLVTLE
jgi:hypothetical protein